MSLHLIKKYTSASDKKCFTLDMKFLRKYELSSLNTDTGHEQSLKNIKICKTLHHTNLTQVCLTEKEVRIDESLI